MRKGCLSISNFATLADAKIALTWSNVCRKWNEQIGCYAQQKIGIGLNSKFKKTWIEHGRHLCVCPLTDHRREPIRMRELLGLLHKILHWHCKGQGSNPRSGLWDLCHCSFSSAKMRWSNSFIFIIIIIIIIIINHYYYYYFFALKTREIPEWSYLHGSFFTVIFTPSPSIIMNWHDSWWNTIHLPSNVRYWSWPYAAHSYSGEGSINPSEIHSRAPLHFLKWKKGKKNSYFPMAQPSFDDKSYVTKLNSTIKAA